MRMLGALFTVVLCAAAGCSRAYGLRMRENLLKNFAEDMMSLLRELEYRPRSIREIAGELCGGRLDYFWKKLYIDLGESEKAEDAWRKAVNGCSEFSCLKRQELKVIYSAGAGLGQRDMKSQAKVVDAAMQEALERAKGIGTEVEQKGAMYSKLGLLMGLGLALLLI